MYAYQMTRSMQEAINETSRRREVQQQYNQKHGITPTTIKKNITVDFLGQSDEQKSFDNLIAQSQILTEHQLDQRILELEKQMLEKSKEKNFEEAIKIRDELRALKKIRLLS